MIRPLGYDSHSNSSDFICGLCRSAKSQYTCPNCSTLYCSVECYNSSKHSSCSEKFYQHIIEQHLSKGDKHEPSQEELNDKKKLVTLLHKYSVEDVSQEDETTLDVSSTTRPKPELWKYNAPKGVRESVQSLQSVFSSKDLHKLHQTDYAADDDLDDEDRPLTREETHEFEKIVNESTTDELLNMLSPEQRKEFENLIKHGNYVVDEDD